MAMICPHLTQEQAVHAFTTGNGAVAAPPLRVRGTLQILCYHRGSVEEVKGLVDGKYSTIRTKNHPPLLFRSSATSADNTPHTAEARQFAEDNWGDKLVNDTWTEVVLFNVEDPTDLVNDRYHTDQPRTKAILYIALNREINTLINDKSKPESELFDEAIVEMTLDVAVWDEIRGGRGGYAEYNCAHCGDGLNLSFCSGCGHKFKDNFFRKGWHTPLSRRMVKFLRDNRHEFAVDPKIARTAEQRRFAELGTRASGWQTDFLRQQGYPHHPGA